MSTAPKLGIGTASGVARRALDSRPVPPAGRSGEGWGGAAGAHRLFLHLSRPPGPRRGPGGRER